LITNCGVGIHTDKPLPMRREADFYPTDPETVRRVLGWAMGYCDHLEFRSVIDAGAGAGVWGQQWRALDPDPLAHWVTGIELREQEWPEGFDQWLTGPKHGDFLKYTLRQPRHPDIIIGNPPFSQAEPFIRHALQWLPTDGILVFLLRLSFLEGQKRRDGLFSEHPPRAVAVCSKRPSFTGDGKTNATAFAAFLWRKGYGGSPDLHWLT
jgi:hypothetical protein